MLIHEVPVPYFIVLFILIKILHKSTHISSNCLKLEGICANGPVVSCWERADLLALVGDVYCILVTFLCGILGQVRL